MINRSPLRLFIALLTSATLDCGAYAASDDAYELTLQGIALAKRGESAAAATKFREAMRLAPEQDQIAMNLAIVLLEERKYPEVIDVLTKVTARDPSNAQAWRQLAAAHEGMAQLEPALSAYKKALPLKQEEARLVFIKSRIANLEVQIERLKMIGPTDGTDYLNAILIDGAARWQKQTPIPVFVAHGTGKAGYRPEHRELVLQAFADWERAAEGAVKFNYVNSEEDARLVCAWTDSRQRLGHADSGGETIFSPVPKTQTAMFARMTFLTRPDLTPGESDKRMRAASLHEVGHSLGLHGHSSDPNDVMYYSATAQNLSERDKKTIVRYYNDDVAFEKAGPMRHAKDYQASGGEETSHHKAVRLNNEGNQLGREGKYLEAIDKYNECLAIESDYMLARNNLAICYQHLAIKAEQEAHYQKAADYYAKCIQLMEGGIQKGQVPALLAAQARLLERSGNQTEAAAVRNKISKLSKTK